MHVAEQERPDGVNVMTPYFVAERPAEGGPIVYTDSKNRREAVRTMFAMIELNDVDKTTLWRTAGSRGLMVELIATAMLHNPGLYEAVGAMMDLMQQDAARKGD